MDLHSTQKTSQPDTTPRPQHPGIWRYSIRQSGLRLRWTSNSRRPLIPPELRHFLGRSIHETTLKTALRSNKPVFIKPSRKTKRFTGFVYSGTSPSDILNVSPFEPVWASEVINIQAEWRTYCCNKKPLYTAWCDGNKHAPPSQAIIADICSSMPDNAPYTAGCAIDTAVTTTGQTVLLEINDGYSLGAYDNVPAIDYYLVIHNRWLASSNLQYPGTLRT